MSLLLDALKKAELAKQAAQESVPGGDELRIEPVDSSAAATDAQSTAGKNLPELPPQLEILDAEFMAHAEASKKEAPGKTAEQPAAESARPQAPAGKARPAQPRSHEARGGRVDAGAATKSEAERTAASQLFSAKQPDRSRKGLYISLALLLVVGLAAIGGYVWWQLKPKSALTAPGFAANISKPPPAPSALPAPPPQAPVAAIPPAPAAGTIAPATSAEKKQAGDDDDEAPVPKARPRAAAQPPLTDAERPIRITRAPLKVNATAARAFGAFQSGDLDAAKAEYIRLLEAEPRNGDALRGLAAVAIRRGETAVAADWYLKALEADPKDALAQAGLIGLRGAGSGDPGEAVAIESRLKSLIASQPDVGALHFALGNVYARQQRWSEAQQSYFRAFSSEPTQPDYAFNLAVSLDHLRQPRPAAQYYRLALDLAAQKSAGFDKAKAEARLRELQP